MKKILTYCSLILILAFTFSCKTSSISPSSQDIVEIIFLQINDVYEIGPLEGGKSGGMARVATLRKMLLSENPYVYTVLAGDFLNPSVIGTVKLDGQRIKGAHMVDIMNKTGVDIVTFGNHEFDLEEDELQARLNESTFTWVGGNVLHNTSVGKQPFEIRRGDAIEKVLPYYILSIDRKPKPLKIGILSVCIDVNQPNYVLFEDAYTTAKTHFEELKAQTDFVIGLTHLAIVEDEKLATEVPGMPLIMGGHEHANVSKRVGDTYITKADANAKTAYIHRIRYNRQTKKVNIKSELKALDENILLDAEIHRLVQEWEDKAYKAFRDQGFDLETPITILKKPLEGREFIIRNEATNLGKVITQAMVESYPDTDIGMINSGAVRLDDQLFGAITEFDLIRTLPYGGKILKVKLKGDLLKKVLDVGLLNKNKGGYLQTYGVKKQGNKWLIEGKEIMDQETYQAAVVDFLLTGKEENLGFFTPDNPGVLSVKEPSGTDIQRDIRLLLADFLKKQ